MKNLNQNLLNSLNKENLTLVKCLKIILANGKILAFTEYSKDLNIDNIIYKASNGFFENKNQQHCDVTPNNEEIVAFVENNDIKKEDIIAGIFDDARVDIFYVDYENIEYGKIIITSGFIGTINFDNNKIYLSINGILSLMDKTIGETYSPLCRAKFCDKKCSLNAEKYTFLGKIKNIISEIEFNCFESEITNKKTNYFKYGLIKFTSGKNKNSIAEIKQSVGSNIVLNSKLLYNLEENDEFEIFAGCNKKFNTCIEKFNNAINFRGEPNLPGTTKVYKFY